MKIIFLSKWRYKGSRKVTFLFNRPLCRFYVCFWTRTNLDPHEPRVDYIRGSSHAPARAASLKGISSLVLDICQNIHYDSETCWWVFGSIHFVPRFSLGGGLQTVAHFPRWMLAFSLCKPAKRGSISRNTGTSRTTVDTQNIASATWDPEKTGKKKETHNRS